jgi:hypothetical protein
MANKSLYETTENQRTNYKNLGFNYQDKLFEKTLSSQITANENNKGIIKTIEAIMVELIEKVKSIKTSVNFIVPKNHKKIN